MKKKIWSALLASFLMMTLALPAWAGSNLEMVGAQKGDFFNNWALPLFFVLLIAAGIVWIRVEKN